MFLERKFARQAGAALKFEPSRCSELRDTDWRGMPEVVYDIVCNIQILLMARRNYDHVVSDFGFSPNNGQAGLSAQLERLNREVPGALARYERRFELSELEADVDDGGRPFLRASGRVQRLNGSLTICFSVTGRKITRVQFVPDSSE